MRTRGRQKTLVTSLAITGISIPLAMATPVLAQQETCVYLESSAKYTARMRIASGDFKTAWSESFPIGKHKCQSLAQIVDGQLFSVQVHAIAGKTKTCSPSGIPRVANSLTRGCYELCCESGDGATEQNADEGARKWSPTRVSGSRS
jgi:hypothetical protein